MTDSSEPISERERIRQVVNALPSVDDILAYESGQMDDEQIVDFFQRLIDSGMAWQLQGSYGRTARALIEAGYCTPAK